VNNKLGNSTFRSLSLTAPIVTLLLSFTGSIQASSLNVSYGQLKQHVSYADRALTLTPTGPSLALSMDLNDHYSIDLDYQNWRDDKALLSLFKADSDLKSWGAGLNYFKDNWSYSASFNQSTDDILFSGISNDANYSNESTQSTSYGLSAGYGWAQSDRFYNLSAGLNYSDWQSTTTGQLEEPRPPSGPNAPPRPPRIITIMQANDADGLSFNSSFSVAQFWSLKEDRGILVGAIVSWNYTISGDELFISQVGRNNNQGGNSAGGRQGGANNIGNNAISSVSGDENYGQLSLYISYDLTSSWSIDVDTGFDFGTDTNDQSWSMSLGYFF
jgi:hypothetical protein